MFLSMEGMSRFTTLRTLHASRPRLTMTVRVPSDTSFKLSLESEQPAAKKRKLTPSAPTNSQPSQSSFADVLERLKEEAGESKGTFARIRSIVF